MSNVKERIARGCKRMLEVAYMRYLCTPNANYAVEWERYQAALAALALDGDEYYDYVAAAF